MRQWQVAAGLIYGQVQKSYRRRQLVRVTHAIRLGTEADLKASLLSLGFSGRWNMAFIERVNLTVRHGIAALARRTWATAQQAPQLLVHLEWWRAYYHFVRPHDSVRIALLQPRERGDKRLAQHYRPANEGSGSRENEPTVDSKGSALVPLAAGFRLRATGNQSWLQCHAAKKTLKVPAEALGCSLASGRGGLSGLSTDENTSPKWDCRG